MKKITLFLFMFFVAFIGFSQGQDCTDPIVIGTLPYTTTDDTANYGDNYGTADRPALGGEQYTDGTGSASYLTGDDAVYAFTPAANGVYSFELSNTLDDWIGFWLFEGCPFTSIVARHTATSGTTRSLPNLNLVAGTTYYAVISTWPAPQSTTYTLDITQITCPDPSGLDATNITTTSADLSWAAGGSEALWDIELVDITAAGTATGTPTAAGIANPYSQMGLLTNNDYEFYVRADCGGGDTSAWVGPFAFATLATCPSPSNLNATGVTSSSADLEWTVGASETLWDIELVDITATGTPTGTPTTSGVTNPYAQMALTPNNDYEFYVRADCGGGDTSDWAGPFAFSTLCASITPDYTADMSVNVPDSCWNEAGSGDLTTGPMDLGSSDWRQGTSYVLGSSNAINLYSNTDSEWLLSPTFDLSAGGPFQLEVNVAVTNWNAGTVDDTMGSDDEVQLLMTTDGGTTWANIATWNAANEPPVGGLEYIEDLTAITGDVMFAIWATDGAIDDSEDYDFHVGKFRVRAIPSCAEPTGLTATTTSISDVDLMWTAGAAETDWTYEYGVSPYAQGGGGTSGTVMTTPSLSLSGLTPGETYDIYVQANCGGTDSGYITTSWTQPVVGATCETAIDVAALPYNTTDDTANYGDNYSGTPGATGCGTTSAYLGGDDVVYAYTATADTSINIALSAIGGTWSGMFVYTDCANIGTECVAGMGNGGSTADYALDVDVLTGTTYYIVISTWPTPQSITYTLDITENVCVGATATIPTDPIDNTNCPTTVDVSISIDDLGDSSTLTISAEDDLGNPAGTGGTVSATGIFTITNVPVPQTSWSIIIAHESNTDCDVVLGPFVLDCPPANDDLAAAVAITVDEGFCDGTNTNGTNSYASDSAEAVGSCFNAGADNDVWFTFTTPAGTATVDVSTDFTGGTLVDSEIAVYSGTSGSLVEMDCSQDEGTTVLSNGSSWNSLITDLAVTVGETYYVQVAGYASGSTGTFCLDVSTNQVLGITDLENEAAFTYYPNPVKNTLTLNAQNTIEQVSMYNMLGQEVLRATPNNLDSDLDMSNLQAGTYFVKVTIANVTETIRVIKQ